MMLCNRQTTASIGKFGENNLYKLQSTIKGAILRSHLVRLWSLRERLHHSPYCSTNRKRKQGLGHSNHMNNLEIARVWRPDRFDRLLNRTNLNRTSMFVKKFNREKSRKQARPFSRVLILPPAKINFFDTF